MKIRSKNTFNNFIEERVKVKEKCENYKIVSENQTGRKLLELQICFEAASREEIGNSHRESEATERKDQKIYPINNDSIFERKLSGSHNFSNIVVVEQTHNSLVFSLQDRAIRNF